MSQAPPELTLRYIFEIIPAGVILLGKDADIVCVNPWAIKIIGIPREQFIGLNTFEIPSDIQIFDLDDRQLTGADLAASRALIEQQPIDDVTIGIYRPDGRVRWVKSFGRPIEGGGSLAIFLDITTEIHQQRELTEISRRYNDIATIIRMANAPKSISDSLLVETLTPRERAVLRLLGQGMSNRQIADSLGIQRTTVRSHLSSIVSKLEVDNERAAMRVAGRAGLVDLHE